MEALADARADVTAMVRVEAKAADLPGTPQHVVAAFDDPPPAEVLRGFDRVFLLSPAIEEQAELETVFIDALVAAGHGPHVVKVAADGFADPGCEVRFMVSHRQVAAHLNATGLPATYLAPALYMADLLASAVSGWQAEGNLELFDWIRQGGADTVTTAVREVTGVDPQPVQDWLEESRADFEVPPLDLPRSVF